MYWFSWIHIPVVRRIPFLLLFPLFQNASAQDLIWPTDASRLLTSTFGEFRGDHFHAGIDIKTWGREGYPVYAAESGSVVRVQASPYGYGRAVYLQTHSGRFIVYGHLSRFNDGIEALVRDEQNRTGRYRVRLHFEPQRIPLAQGDLVGLSGSTGIGVPHLHFEIRDSLNRPQNPLQFGFPVQDGIAPDIHAVAVSPLTAGSQVNSDFKPDVFGVVQTEDGLYRIDRTLTVHGELGISLAADDRAEGADNRLGVYLTELWIDGERIYTFRNDRFSYEETESAELVFNPHLGGRAGMRFINLFREDGNRLAFLADARPKAGVIRSGCDTGIAEDGSVVLDEGVHTLWIVAADYFGNQSEAFADFEVIAPKPPRAPDSRPWLRDPDPASFPSESRVRLSKRFIRDYLYFSADDPSGLLNEPVLTVQSGVNHRDDIPMIRTHPGRFAGIFPLSLVRRDVLQIALWDGPVPIDRMAVHVACIRPDEGVTVSSPDGRFAVHFPKGSVYGPLWCAVETPFPDTYDVLPDDAPLSGAVRISMHMGDASLATEQWALYRLDEDGAYVFAGNGRGPGGLSASIHRLGRFALMRDTTAPELLSVWPGNGAAIRGRTPRIRIAFRDALSGIGEEDHYIVRLDGSRLIMEYDPEKDTAVHPLADPIPPGEHVLEIQLSDRCGNALRRISRFTVL